jgi:MoaA/NifB/PqqE/SkfB family radical SAM enzyme
MSIELYPMWAADGLSLEGHPLGAGGSAAEAVIAPQAAEPEVGIPSVDWWTTSHCNLTCDFCYGPVPGRDPVELRYDILQAIAASSAGAVTFCGGEPLLVKKVDEWAGVLRQHGKSSVLNTNGELLRRRLGLGFELGNFDLVGISIEGSTPEIHRAMRGGKADLGEVIEAAKIVSAKPGVSLKLGTVISGVNRENLPALARTVRDLSPDVWRLYQYSSRGDQNTGQQRHWLPDGEFQRLADEAAALAAPVQTAPSTETETEGCLIVDPAGHVLQPSGAGYLRLGNCLTEPLDSIWAEMATRATIIKNKRWLSVLS